MKQFIIPKIVDFKGWNKVDTLLDFSYPWETEQPPATSFSAYYDSDYLHFNFIAWGENPLVYRKDNHKTEVIYSERIELFFRSDDQMQPYYCLEIDPFGRVFDYKAAFYRQFDEAWSWPDSLSISAKIEKDYYVVEGKILLSTLKKLHLLKNQQIELGLYRGHCTALIGKEATLKWISWVNSNTVEPDFHVPSSFGLLQLS